MPKKITLTDIEKKVLYWQENPGDFIYNVMNAKSIPDFSFTTQQQQLLDDIGNLVKAKKMTSMAPEEMTEEQRLLAKKMGATLKSGKGTGKTFILANILWWWVICFNDSEAVCTSKSFKQLQSTLWKEVGQARERSIIKSSLEKESYMAYIKDFGKDKCFIIARTTNAKSSPEEQAATLAGHHARRLLMLVDEAAEIPDAVFRQFYSTMTNDQAKGGVNIAILAFNPTRDKGFALDTQGKDAELWVVHHWSSRDSEIVSKSYIEMMEKKYGKESMDVRVFIDGEPPEGSDGSLIPWEWLCAAENLVVDERAQEDLFPLILSIDPAAGGDDSGWAFVQGAIVHKTYARVTPKSTDCVLQTETIIEDFGRMPAIILIDVIQIGQPIYELLRMKYGSIVKKVDVRWNAARPERFFQLRDEMWWSLRTEFEMGNIRIAKDDPILKTELSQVRFKTDQKTGRIKILSKEEMRRKHNIKSPNRGDAVMMTRFVKNNTKLQLSPMEDSALRLLAARRRALMPEKSGFMGV